VWVWVRVRVPARACVDMQVHTVLHTRLPPPATDFTNTVNHTSTQTHTCTGGASKAGAKAGGAKAGGAKAGGAKAGGASKNTKPSAAAPKKKK
jgi:hypothetical protein